MNRRAPIRSASLALVALTVSAAACATVSPEEMETRLTTLREEVSQEIERGDQQVRDDLGNRIDGVESRVAGLEQDLAALEGEFDATVERLETAIRFNVPVHFAFDRATVRERDRAMLDRFGRVVQGYYPDALVTVEGFTDPAGSEAYNRRLGQARADAVKAYLVERAGLYADRIRTVSYGEARERQVVPGAQGPGEAGEPNRRVVLVIDHGGEPPSSRPTVTVPQVDEAPADAG